MKDLQEALKWKEAQENTEMESLQVRNYNQTIIQATLTDETEALLVFMEELVKRLRRDNSAEDCYAFQQLSEGDQERVNEVLNKVGISYQT